MIAAPLKSFFKKIFSTNKIEFTGAYKRHLEIIDELEIVIDNDVNDVENKLSAT